jgi:hypothetical protein
MIEFEQGAMQIPRPDSFSSMQKTSSASVESIVLRGTGRNCGTVAFLSSERSILENIRKFIN